MALEGLTGSNELGRFADLVSDLVNDRWGDGFVRLEVAPVVLGKFHNLPLRERRSFRSVLERAEKELRTDLRQRPIDLESFSMTAAVHGQESVLTLHVNKLLTCPDYRNADSEGRLRYFANSPEATVEHIYRHIRERSADRICHDVGTVLTLTERRCLSTTERFFLGNAMVNSLRELGVSQALEVVLPNGGRARSTVSAAFFDTLDAV